MALNTIGNTKVNDVANFFPMLEGSEFEDLVKDPAGTSSDLEAMHLGREASLERVAILLTPERTERQATDQRFLASLFENDFR